MLSLLRPRSQRMINVLLWVSRSPVSKRRSALQQPFPAPAVPAPDRSSRHQLLIELGPEAAQLLARELLAELARRQPEMGAEAAREDLGTGEAAGRGDVLDRDVAVEERI